MAIWQVDFMIVKKEVSEENISENINKIIVWKNSEVKKQSIDNISSTLLYEKSWCDEIEQYGKIDGTCIKILHIDDSTVEISCRLDLREITIDVIKVIIEFIKINEGVILVDNMFYNPTTDNMKYIIEASSAYKFCKNPYKFLDGLTNR